MSVVFTNTRHKKLDVDPSPDSPPLENRSMRTLGIKERRIQTSHTSLAPLPFNVPGNIGIKPRANKRVKKMHYKQQAERHEGRQNLALPLRS